MPAKLTKLLPCVAPNPEPVTVTCAPNLPPLGDTAVTTLFGIVNCEPLLKMVLTDTTAGPVTAPCGTVATIWLPLQLVIAALAPELKVTKLFQATVGPKPDPEIVTVSPAPALDGEMLVICGGGTVKVTPLLATPPSVTIMLPLTV